MKDLQNSVKTWIEIDTRAIAHNYRIFRKIIGQDKLLLAVAKSNAYGHNLTEFAPLVAKLGADWIGVDSLVEALALRRAGLKKPILVFGYTLPSKFSEAAVNNASLTVSNLESLKYLVSRKFRPPKPLRVHLKIDTGMHRQGFLPSQLGQVIALIRQRPKNFILEGVYTHFAAAKNPAFPTYTEYQVKNFETGLAVLSRAGYNPVRHAAATSGTLLFPQARFDMVRVGIGLYGLWPSPQAKAALATKFDLKPVLSWRTIISEIKKLPRGSKIGYDLTEVLTRPALVAICPIGYWHGYPRHLSGIGQVLVKGQEARILGRVSMDVVVIDVSGVSNPKVGDMVTLIGRDGQNQISADDLAGLADTINYEIVTRINPLIKRIYR